jgi:tRNA(fMet)-specific endonuclease VapC
MTRLLDTDVCIEYLRGTDAAIRDRLRSLAPADVCLCSVVKAELLFGAHHSQHVATNLRRLRDFFAPMTSLVFDDDAAERYGQLRAHLRREGREIGAHDMMIAAIALVQDATVVTRNEAEFARVPGLSLERW